jgi:polyphosphate kinase
VVNLRDAAQSWDLEPDGSWRRRTPDPRQFSAHEYFMTNPSLSGRGSALHAPTPRPPSHRPLGRRAKTDRLHQD